MIDIFAVLVHWCASCVSDGNVIPGAAGVLGGAAGAVGGLGGLTPMRDLLPPGATANPDGSLSWPNPDGTTSTKDANHVITTTSPTGPTTTQYPGGPTETVGTDGTRTVTDSSGHTTTWRPDDTETSQDPGGPSTVSPFDGTDGDDGKYVGPNDKDPMDDPNGNALVGLVAGIGAAANAGVQEGASGAIREIVSEGPAEVVKMAWEAAKQKGGGEQSEPGSGEGDGGSDHPGEYDEPDATVPDASVGNTYPSEPGDAGAPAPAAGGDTGASQSSSSTDTSSGNPDGS